MGLTRVGPQGRQGCADRFATQALGWIFLPDTYLPHIPHMSESTEIVGAEEPESNCFPNVICGCEKSM